VNIDLILFDWGGTLSQVETQDARLREGAAKAAGLLCGPHADGLVKAFVEAVLCAESNAAADPELREADLMFCLREWTRDNGLSLNERTIAEAGEALGNAWVGSLCAFPGSAGALAALKASGYRLGLVSNCMLAPEYCREEFRRHGLAEYMEFTVFSSEVGYRKPHPAIYKEALRRAYGDRAPADLSQVMFVGDSPRFDVMTPASMGMKTALVTCHRGIWPKGDYELAKPDFRIDSVAELPGLLGAR
jgi:FMN phosphatase YigB (HAD superfamily)